MWMIFELLLATMWLLLIQPIRQHCQELLATLLRYYGVSPFFSHSLSVLPDLAIYQHLGDLLTHLAISFLIWQFLNLAPFGATFQKKLFKLVISIIFRALMQIFLTFGRPLMQVFCDFKIALMQVFWGFQKFSNFLFKRSGSTVHCTA